MAQQSAVYFAIGVTYRPSSSGYYMWGRERGREGEREGRGREGKGRREEGGGEQEKERGGER